MKLHQEDAEFIQRIAQRVARRPRPLSPDERAAIILATRIAYSEGRPS